MKANEEAIKAFNAAIVRLNDNVTLPLKEAIAKQPNFIDDDLQKRLELLANELTDLAKRGDTMMSREKPKKFFSFQDDQWVIQELNRDLDRIVMAFTGRGSIGAEMEARKASRSAQTLIINKLPRAQARYDSASRVGANPCFQGTRSSILHEISSWIENPSAPPIFWLSGMAGIGKSTIAHTIAEQEDKKHRLGASFFFSRDEADRRSPHLVYPTMAFQLAGFDSSLREPIIQALEQDTDIGHAMMQKQFEQLIAGPLEKFKGAAKTILFVLDALDECSPSSGALEILARWAVGLPQIFNQVGVMLKVLITSRPELHIHDQFNYSPLHSISQSFVLHDIEKTVVKADIELFLTGRLTDLATLHGVSQPWPTVAEISSLASRSDNLFIFASTTVNFIGGAKSGRSLQHRLDHLLRPDSNVKISAFAQLDALYLRVLESAEKDLEATLLNAKETFHLVLETIVLLLDPLSPTSLGGLLSLHPDDVITSIQDLRSVLVIPANSDSVEPIRFFHPSFYDFITTPGRESGPFFITTTDGHARLAKLCLKTMLELLRKDPCSIGNPWTLNSDVVDLESRLDRAAPNHLRYSCRFFCSHISLCGPGDKSLEQLLDSFCESKILVWLEMMSLLGDIGGAINSIQLLRSWCNKNSTVIQITADLIHDTSRVLLQYQSPLSLSAGHLYTTVPSFAPVCSLTKQYASQLHVPYAIRGRPAQWDSNLITMDTQRKFLALAFFPDGKRVATGDDRGRISVWNISTGAEIISIYGQDTPVSAFSLDISADGARIASSKKGEEETHLHIWDSITGSCISRLGEPGRFPPDTSIAFLPDAPELLSWSENGMLHRWNSVTGGLVQAYKLPVETSVKISLSPHGSILAIKDLDQAGVWTYEGGIFTPVEAHIPWQEYGENDFLLDEAFLLDTKRVLFVLNESPLIPGGCTLVSLWDYQNGLEIKTITFSAHAKVAGLCKETKRMAILTTELPIQIWDIESATLLAQLDEYAPTGIRAAFSPTDMLLASVDEHGSLRTWDISPPLSRSNPNALETDRHACTIVSASRSGNDVISMYSGSTTAVLLWNIAEKTCVELNLPNLDLSLEMSSDGLYVVCATVYVGIHSGWVLYETRSLQCVYSWNYTGSKYYRPDGFVNLHAAFSEDSKLVAVTLPESSWDNHASIEVLDIDQRRKLLELDLPVQLKGMAFLPEGASLVIVHKAGYDIYSVSSGSKSEFTTKWGPELELPAYFTLSGIVPDGAQLLVRGFDGPMIPSYLVTIKDSSQVTRYTESSYVFQIFGTSIGWKPSFLVHDQMGYLYKRDSDSRKLLCWLPPTWRFMNGIIPAVWRGNHLIVGLPKGEIGIIDLDALSHD
ncbi:hypothetical protein FRC00_012494 [Tulasnella sp. 408]|nr:hypothetical protein FRC00_012494 [Tulasnella sp. 408]